MNFFRIVDYNMRNNKYIITLELIPTYLPIPATSVLQSEAAGTELLFPEFSLNIIFPWVMKVPFFSCYYLEVKFYAILIGVAAKRKKLLHFFSVQLFPGKKKNADLKDS